MVISKQIKDWRKILLDTSVLCALFRSEHSPTIDAQTEFVLKLITYLTKNKTSDGQERIFLVSTITISELLTKENDSEKIKRILKVLNSKNVEFVDFDLMTALQFNKVLHPQLGKASLHQMAAGMGFKSNDYMMAREWITRDFMIIMSGVERNADVILTADKNTFYPACVQIGNADCVLVYPELFDSSDNFILRYKDDEVDSFLNPKIPVIVKPNQIASSEIKGEQPKVDEASLIGEQPQVDEPSIPNEQPKKNESSVKEGL